MISVDDAAQEFVEFLQMAETPLYSAWRWLGDRGHPMSPAEFLSFVDHLLEQDTVQLWETEFGTGDRSEHFVTPKWLFDRYKELDHDDKSYDPCGFSLSIGMGLTGGQMRSRMGDTSA